MTTHRTAAGAAVLLGALLLGAGCTEDPAPPRPTAPATSTPSATATSPTPSASLPTAAEVARSARMYALAASSATVRGTVRVEDGRTLTIDLSGNSAGTNQRLRLTVPEVGTAEVLTVGGRYWLGGDEGFWTEQLGDAAAAEDVVGRWVLVTESDVSELGDFRLRTLLTEAFSRPEVTALEAAGTPVAAAEVDGREAWVVGPEAGPRLWVAADGGGELLRYLGPTSGPADLAFTGWERAETVQEPPPGDVVEQE